MDKKIEYMKVAEYPSRLQAKGNRETASNFMGKSIIVPLKYMKIKKSGGCYYVYVATKIILWLWNVNHVKMEYVSST